MQRRTLIIHGLQGALAAAAWSLSLNAAAQGKAVKIGMLIPQSGPAALFGPSSKSCAELAAEEINARGGLAGRRIELVFGDAGLPPAEVSQAALRM